MSDSWPIKVAVLDQRELQEGFVWFCRETPQGWQPYRKVNLRQIIEGNDLIVEVSYGDTDQRTEEIVS